MKELSLKVAATLAVLFGATVVHAAPQGVPVVTRCDELASSATDPNQAAPPVVLDRALAGAARRACEKDLKKTPGALRARNQLVASMIAAAAPLAEIMQAGDVTLPGMFGGEVTGYADTLYQIARHILRNGDTMPTTMAEQLLRKGSADGHVPSMVAFAQSFVDRPEGIAALYYRTSHYHELRDAIARMPEAEREPLATLVGNVRQAFARRGEINVDGRRLSQTDARTSVADETAYPFGAIGKLQATTDDGTVVGCSATLIGNRRTIVSAAHCLRTGARYAFLQGSGLDRVVPARIVARGAFESERLDYPEWNTGAEPPPNTSWDDWAVLDLEQPVDDAEPVGVPSGDVMAAIVEGRRTDAHYAVAGYPGDVMKGRRMTHSVGCGLRPTRQSFARTYVAKTNCRAYQGLSGASVLMIDGAGKFRSVGVISATYGPTALKQTFVVVSYPMLEAVAKKLLTDARPALGAGQPSAGSRIMARSVAGGTIGNIEIGAKGAALFQAAQRAPRVPMPKTRAADTLVIRCAVSRTFADNVADPTSVAQDVRTYKFTLPRAAFSFTDGAWLDICGSECSLAMTEDRVSFAWEHDQPSEVREDGWSRLRRLTGSIEISRTEGTYASTETSSRGQYRPPTKARFYLSSPGPFADVYAKSSWKGSCEKALDPSAKQPKF